VLLPRIRVVSSRRQRADREYLEGKMTKHFGSVSVEEQIHGDTEWVAVRARGAEWSWLTPLDALLLARHWIATYEATATAEAADMVSSSSLR
jgi:hypothetical protein